MKTTFKNFLLEAAPHEKLDRDSAIQFARNHCMAAIKNPNALWRGVRINDSLYCTVNPHTTLRPSANTTNYYNLLLSNIPSWKEYPPRNRSLIATGDVKYAESFSNGTTGNIFRVFPIDNSVMGICPQFDIWNSFKHASELLGQYNTLDGVELNEIIYSFILHCLNLKSGKFDGNFEELRSYLIQVDKKLLSMNPQQIEDLIIDVQEQAHPQAGKSIVRLIRGTVKEKSSIIFFDKIFDPDDNGFRVERISTGLHFGNNEVWTNGECLLVHKDREKAFIKMVLEK